MVSTFFFCRSSAYAIEAQLFVPEGFVEAVEQGTDALGKSDRAQALRAKVTGAKNLQCSARKLRINRVFCNETIKLSRPKGAMNPRKGRGRHEDHVIRASDRQPERRHVLDCLAKQTIKFLVAGLDLGHVLEPVRHRAAWFKRHLET
jgi:hypothetical protein